VTLSLSLIRKRAAIWNFKTRKGIGVTGSRILVMGLAFKENCPDAVTNTDVSVKM
jgi:UDP-N-acetyl-D-mannosaminuronate dehydrogenase